MNVYGISQIKWDASNKFVEKVLLHNFTKEKNGQMGINTGEAKFHYDVASQILCGDDVYTLIIDGPGSYRTGDRVGVKAEQKEYLESVNEQGQPSLTLYELPYWTDLKSD